MYSHWPATTSMIILMTLASLISSSNLILSPQCSYNIFYLYLILPQVKPWSLGTLKHNRPRTVEAAANKFLWSHSMTNSARVSIPSFITSCGFSDHKSSRDHLIKNHHGNILHTHVCLPSASSVAGADWFDNAKALNKAHGRKNNRRQMWGSKGRLPQIKAPDYRDWRLAPGWEDR